MKRLPTKASVIVVTYDHRKYMKNCLSSVLVNSPLEVIVVEIKIIKDCVKAITMELSQIPDKKRRALESFVRILKGSYGDRIRKIILFGSAVRGEAEEDSDIDVLIVANEVSQKEISRISLQILMKYGEVISSIVEDEQQFEKNKDYTFHQIVLKEGVEIG